MTCRWCGERARWSWRPEPGSHYVHACDRCYREFHPRPLQVASLRGASMAT